MKNIFQKISLAIILLFMVTVVNAQDKGVRFVGGSWQEILTRAKAEHKFIFVDYYATWCGPCKLMDRDVYPNDTVGLFMNNHFLSVKMQLDTTKNDDETVRSRYADSHQLLVTYKILEFPTFLFFDNEGRIISRAVGLQTSKAFIQIAEAVTQSHYYAELADYHSGKKYYSTMANLATNADKLREKELSRQIAADYIQNYLGKLDLSNFLTKTNLDFMGHFAMVVTENDRVFQMSYEHPVVIDSTERSPGYARRWVNYVITKEVINPQVNEAKQSGKEPDWMQLTKNIRAKYGAGYAESNVLAAKVGWFHSKKSGAEYTKYLTIQTDKNLKAGLIKLDFWGVFGLNNAAWDVFLYDTNRSDLEKALAWVKRINENDHKPDATHLDTQAGLLYKLGRKDEALKLEQQAITVDPQNKDIAANFEKMKKGEKTWADKME